MRGRPPSLVELTRAIGEGWCAIIAAAEHGEAHVGPGGCWGIGGEPSAEVNWVVAYGPKGAGDAVRSGALQLHQRGLPGTVFAASPAAEEVAAAAAELDLPYAGTVPLMCVHATDAVRADSPFETRLVGDLDGVLAAGEVLGDAFELPVDWCRSVLGVGLADLTNAQVFLACQDGRPVAAAGVAGEGALAGIYYVGTRRAHRRRGAAAACVSAAIDYRIRAGAHWFGLFSEPDAEPFYTALGFTTVDHVAVWVLEAA